MYVKGLAITRADAPNQDELVFMVEALREMHNTAAGLLHRAQGGTFPLIYLDPAQTALLQAQAKRFNETLDIRIAEVLGCYCEGLEEDQRVPEINPHGGAG